MKYPFWLLLAACMSSVHAADGANTRREGIVVDLNAEASRLAPNDLARAQARELEHGRHARALAIVVQLHPAPGQVSATAAHTGHMSEGAPGLVDPRLLAPEPDRARVRGEPEGLVGREGSPEPFLEGRDALGAGGAEGHLGTCDS